LSCAAAALISLAAPSEARPPASPRFAAPAPPEAKTASVIASWYGEDFDGNETASGEIYDMTALTAAHRSLPLGTKIRVTNLKNNRSLVLRVNDRGPYISGRALDVSMAAAEQLGFLRAGLAEVQIEIMSQPPAISRPEGLVEAAPTILSPN